MHRPPRKHGATGRPNYSDPTRNALFILDGRPKRPAGLTAKVGQRVQDIHTVVNWQQSGNFPQNMNLTHLLRLTLLW